MLPFKDEVVTVLLLAVKAVKVVTSHKNMALSKPADATYNNKTGKLLFLVLKDQYKPQSECNPTFISESKISTPFYEKNILYEERRTRF